MGIPLSQEEAMVQKLVVCPYWHGSQVGKRGKTDTGKQRYRCHNPECDHQSFLLNSAYKGRSPEIKQQIERKHLTLRTRIKRLARKTICFSKSPELHDIVIGLFVNCQGSRHRGLI